MSTETKIVSQLKNGRRLAVVGQTLTSIRDPTPSDIASRLKPFRQGSLDSYCGIYAIANAILRLQPDWLGDYGADVAHLLSKMMKGASRLCRPEELFAQGMDGAQLKELAKLTVKQARKLHHHFDLLSPYDALQDVGYRSEEPVGWLSAASGEKCLSVILHIEERGYNHWSVLKSVKRNRIYLFDSDGMNFTHISRCEPWICFKARAVDDRR